MLVICPATYSGFSWVLLVILRVWINYVIKRVSLKFLIWWSLCVVRGIKINYAHEIGSNLCSISLSVVMLELSIVMRETAFSGWLQRTQALCWTQPTITECKPQQDCGIPDTTVIILQQVKVMLCGYELLMLQ